MRKTLWIFLGLTFLLAGAAAFFLMNFDADRYRPFLVSKLESLVGNPVAVERIGVAWRDGLALEARGVKIYQDQSKTQILVSAGRISGALKFADFMTRQIQISSIEIETPQARLVIGTDGKLQGFENFTKRQGLEGHKGQAAALSFLIRDILIRDGRISVRDLSARVPAEYEIHSLEGTIQNESLYSRLGLNFKAAFLSGSPNIFFEGKLKVSLPEGKPYLEQVKIQADLGSLALKDLEAALPELAGQLSGPPAGRLTVETDSLSLASSARNMNARLRLEGAKLHLARMSFPLENMTLQASVADGRLTADPLSIFLGRGSVKGTLEHPFLAPEPVSSVRVEADGLRIDDFTSQASGLLAGKIEGNFQGRSWPVLSRTFSGEGGLTLQDAIIRDFNLLAEVFGKLSAVPGLGGTLEKRLPASYQEKLRARDTLFKPLDLTFRAEQGVLDFANLQIVSDGYGLAGTARLSLDGGLGFQGMLVLDRTISLAFIDSVRELEYLIDPYGQIQIPLQIQGSVPDRVRVIPDLAYIASKLAVSKTQEVLTGLFRKKEEAGQTQSGQPASAQDSAGQPKGLFAQLLEAALEGTEKSSGT